MSHTVDDSTAASHPGGITVSPEKYLAYYRITGIRAALLRLLIRLPRQVLFERFRNLGLVYRWINTCEQMEQGCLNPVVVLDAGEGLVAAYTDLTATGETPAPAVKIFRERLELAGRPVANGQRMAAVSLYYRDPEDPYAPCWQDFDPKVADCFTGDTAALRAAMNRLSAEDWDHLRAGLAKIRDKTRPGLYRFRQDENGGLQPA